MSEDQALRLGRAAAERLMHDTVRLYRQGPDIFDRNTGTTVPGPQTTLYAGRGRVKPVLAIGEDVQAGEREVVLRDYVVSLPYAAQLPAGSRVLPGDRVEVTAPPDARVIGLELWVTGAKSSASATAWRIAAEDRA